ncbi:hypothetical protein [Robiginitalea biformata]|uniref:Uncharacterized protein n=1 Tax=Robiginitalea biformata (strain ATCC BAA-864 / DSM 15991 / KCTC 12146 / HTCC2501) TaxID=313596 RepID=A4CI98_ROBBH|nr:hypothetical protein [Robiginitalea biformata]EAR16656.1 hypothetical protein RB2501_07140 [Robiginitalea biformata HTCC2501]
MVKYWQDYYHEYLDGFEKQSDDELVRAFNSQVHNGGWGAAKQGYLAAIRQSLEKRNIDYSEVGDESSMSYRNHVFLVEGKLLRLSAVPIQALIPLVKRHITGCLNIPLSGDLQISHITDESLIVNLDCFPYSMPVSSKALSKFP